MDVEDNGNISVEKNLTVPVGEKTKLEADCLVELLEDLLIRHKTEDADIILSAEKIECFQDKTMDFIITLCNYLTEKHFTESPQVFHCCEILLERVVRYGNPRESVLQLLQNLRSLDLSGFLCVLKPLGIVLTRLSSLKFLKWCLETICELIPDLMPTVNQEEKSQKDDFTNEIINAYIKICDFYKPFLSSLLEEKIEISASNSKSKSTKLIYKETKHQFCILLFQLLGKPLACLDLEYDGNVKSDARLIAEMLIEDLNLLFPDIFLLWQYTEHLQEIEDCPPKARQKAISNTGSELEPESDTEESPVSEENEFNVISVGTVLYLVVAERLKIENVPCVYNIFYVFQRCLYLATVLLKFSDNFVVYKGLLLVDAVINRMLPKTVPSCTLELPQNKSFVKVLINVMVYSQIEKSRKLAADIFRRYLLLLDCKGRYLLVTNLRQFIEHSGVMGYLVTIFKEIVVQSLDDNDASFFADVHFTNILIMFSELKHGPKTDLVEIADQILTVLNFIRYLVIRDKDNLTGFWNVLNKLNECFFKPLSEGILVSRAHYIAKLNELKDVNKANTTEISTQLEPDITVIIGGQKLPNLPIENKISIVNSALNSLDLMESLLCRVKECISEHQKLNCAEIQ